MMYLAGPISSRAVVVRAGSPGPTGAHAWIRRPAHLAGGGSIPVVEGARLRGEKTPWNGRGPPKVTHAVWVCTLLCVPRMYVRRV